MNKELQTIQNKIHTIRDIQVMLDRDLAQMYEVKPTRLREQVRRNINKFPKDFMFELSANEVENMVSQNAIPSKQHLGGSMSLKIKKLKLVQPVNVIYNSASENRKKQAEHMYRHGGSVPKYLLGYCKSE